MVGRLQEKIALVVGAGSIGPGWGNGKAAAVLFAREGAKVLGFFADRAAKKWPLRGSLKYAGVLLAYPP